jgi:DNA-binding CsgD family transcriptional regulator
MRFREATDSDVPALATLFDGRNALPLPAAVRESLPAILHRLVASPACTLTVFEEEDRSGLRVSSFAGGLFPRDEVIDSYLAAPSPALLASVLARLGRGEEPLLTLEEVRRANAGQGLNLLVFPIPLGKLEWSDARTEQLRKIAPQAFVRAIGGYRLRSIYYEVFTDDVASYLQAGGYRLLHDFSAQSGTGSIPPGCRPRMLQLTADDLPPGAMSLASQMFSPPAAHLGLTFAEQRVALRALDGASDRAIADALGLSTETVRSNWRSIYQRLHHVLADVSVAVNHGEDTARGVEKRRVAIEYLRQNMHELRPTPAAARRGPSATT